MQAGKDQYADVCIWTVKFSVDKGGSSVLKRIAELGGGEYREALSSTEFRSALSDFASEFVHAAFKIGDEVKLRALTKHFKHKYNGKIALVKEYIQEKDQVRVKVSEGGEELNVKVQNLEAQESDKENDTSFDSSSTSSSCRDLYADVSEAEEEALPIKVGDAVKLHSLGRRKQKHNGKTGVVQAYIKEKDVFRVKLREGTEVLTVKLQNLEAGDRLVELSVSPGHAGLLKLLHQLQESASSIRGRSVFPALTSRGTKLSTQPAAALVGGDRKQY
eukprot:g54303.t1